MARWIVSALPVGLLVMISVLNPDYIKPLFVETGGRVMLVICALMIIVFLIPTFALHAHWLKVLPAMVPVVKSALKEEKAQNYFRSFDRQAYHAHEVGIRDNLVFVAAAVYFAIRGSAAFAVDNWLTDWVIRFF